jgi:hypothetical protein
MLSAQSALALANDIIQQPSASWYKLLCALRFQVPIIAPIVFAGDSLLPIFNGSVTYVERRLSAATEPNAPLYQIPTRFC